MRFMSMSWWSGDDTADRAAEYAAYLGSIFGRLPPQIQALSRIPCHDANLTRLALSTRTRQMLLEMELAGSRTGHNLRLHYEAVDHFVSTGRPTFRDVRIEEYASPGAGELPVR